MRIAVIDDWQDVARQHADWTAIEQRAEVVFFHDAFADEDALAAALLDFDIVLTMRERTAFPRSLIERLPKLAMLGMTGSRAKALDIQAMLERGITVCYTESGPSGHATAELTLALMLAAARQIPGGDASIRSGGFQDGLRPGLGLAGRTLGLIGFGRIGQLVAGYGKALGLVVIAWSKNITPERAAAVGAAAVPRDRVFEVADIVSLHVLLTDETLGLVTEADLAHMRTGAILVNTARAPLIDQQALLRALHEGRIIAALDVFEREPLPADDPFRKAPNTVLTPHLGDWSGDVLRTFYGQTVENVQAFLDGKPIRTHRPAG
jgi:phosphoglycerate dehydrogenase-like enzyme